MPIVQAASKIEGVIKSSTSVISLATVAVFAIAILVFAWGIVRLIAAASNAEEVRKAKGIIWWGLIGMFVLAFMAGIIAFFQGELGVEGIRTIPVPQFPPPRQ